ncbi:thioredoxin domain-containing protein [Anaerobacillus sp. 1_MG-2023]|uniref:DsbA family protein n=1 Tax=Anaerobacillus sp. 1_MG-2023 TaxID=3062655 RepID=UPI0026E31329|nr:thioredoxin domain-containing protein [Anaerobacillus sp. 1_MG-2023]MDO6657075.1 thioredoxin domain-containing protein [Anaerobacillus sp. 1_MG-2023]
MAKPKKKLKPGAKWLLLFAGLVILFLFINFLFHPFANTKGFKLESQPHLGEETAPVEIVQFGDYKCSSCQSFNESLFPKIQEEFIATEKAKYYFVNYPFLHKDSTRAAEFAEVVYKELGNDVFWQFHHVLYDKHKKGSETKDVLTESFLTKTLSGLVSEEETDRVVKAYKSGAGEKRVEADLAYANKKNVSETPTLFVDGKRFEGTSLSELKQMVEDSTDE